MNTTLTPFRRWTAGLGLRLVHWASHPIQAAPTRSGDAWLTGPSRDRWFAPEIRHYTPQLVEQLIREAMGGDLTRQWEMFDLMERTWPRLQGNLKKLREKVQAIEWTVQPWSARGAEPTPEAVRRAGLLEDALWAMRPDPTRDENEFEGMLFDLLDAWGKGVSVQEILWEPRAGIVAPKCTRWVHPRHYGYPPKGEDRLMLRSIGGQDEEWSEFLPDKFLIAVAKQKSGHPCGSALLQALGFFWAATNFSWEWFLNFAQLFGVPIRWANYASTADAATIGKIEQMMQELGSAGWAAFPQGTQLQILEAVKASAEGPQERLIVAADRICDILILGQTLTTDVAGSGSRALGDVHKATLSDREEAVARFAARVLNAQLVPAFCRLNFGTDEECPWLVPDIEEEENSKLIAETFEVALRSGVKIPAKFAHERLGIPQPVDGEEVLVVGPNVSTLPVPLTEKPMAAKSPADRLVVAVAESVTGVRSDWLGGSLPWFEQLIAAAQDASVSDQEFEALLMRARESLPEELAPLLDSGRLMKAMEANMGAAVVNGAVKGALGRRTGAQVMENR